jgi:hypothetical protein
MAKNNITGLSDSGKGMLPTERIPATGMPKTLPPKRPPMREKDPPIGYGSNHDYTASSDLPGERTSSPWAAETEARNPDPLLAAIIGHNPHRGAGHTDHYAVDGPGDWQTRPVNKTGIRPAQNMKPDPNASGSPSGKVAAGLASDEEQPVRKP